MLPRRLDRLGVESARQKSTSDGYRKWIDKAGSLDQLLAFCANESETDSEERVVTSYSDEGGLTVNCDHNIRTTITATELAASIQNVTPGAPFKGFLPIDTPNQDS